MLPVQTKNTTLLNQIMKEVFWAVADAGFLEGGSVVTARAKMLRPRPVFSPILSVLDLERNFVNPSVFDLDFMLRFSGLLLAERGVIISTFSQLKGGFLGTMAKSTTVGNRITQ